MKRVKAACIVQTLHFQLKEDVGENYAKTLVQQEVQNYKEKMNKTGTKYRIISEETFSLFLKFIYFIDNYQLKADCY